MKSFRLPPESAERVRRFAPGLALLVLLLPLGTVWARSGASAWTRNRTLIEESARLESEIDRLTVRNIALRRERRALEQDPYFIERVLREDRGLLAPGEIRLDPPPMAPRRVTILPAVSPSPPPVGPSRPPAPAAPARRTRRSR